MPDYPYPVDPAEYITDDLVVEVCDHTLRSDDNPAPCRWDAVDPVHQTLMGHQLRIMLKHALPVLMVHGWQPPVPTYSKTHPRSRLRDALNELFHDWFKAEGRSVPRRISERLYHWHLAEARAIAHTKVARELNDVADLVEEQALGAGTTKAVLALEQVASELRDRADLWQDTVVDPRHPVQHGVDQ